MIFISFFMERCASFSLSNSSFWKALTANVMGFGVAIVVAMNTYRKEEKWCLFWVSWRMSGSNLGRGSFPDQFIDIVVKPEVRKDCMRFQ